MSEKGKGSKTCLMWTNNNYTGQNDVNRIRNKARKNKYHPDNIK